jgi:hypothetical protein
MVWKSNTDQLEFTAHPFGVTVHEFRRHDLHRLEQPGQRPGQSGCPIPDHASMLAVNWLAHQ